MVISSLYVFTGLVLMIWGAERFVTHSAAAAQKIGIPPLLIGMLVVGFGTSAPELLVSVMSAMEGAGAIALGNAYGSNICNIALILGLVAMIKPVAIQSNILKKELPILLSITVLSYALLWNGFLSRLEASALLLCFITLIVWSVLQQSQKEDSLGKNVEHMAYGGTGSIKTSLAWLITGFAILIFSSRLMVLGAVNLAGTLGISDLIIGLTIVAIGTSLPELASSVVAAVKGQHDIAIGNVIGSNLFNTLAVVGLSGIIQPTGLDRSILTRDLPVVMGLTLLLFFFGFGFFRRPGRINRFEGLVLFLFYFTYLWWLFVSGNQV